MSVGILIPENLRYLGPECCFQGIGGANCLLPTSCSSTYYLPRSQWVDLLEAVHQLLDQGVITPVPAGECFQGFYLNLLFVPKPNGRVWRILHLKTLSGSEILHGKWQKPHCRLPSGGCLSTHSYVLCFAVGNQHYQLVTIPLACPRRPGFHQGAFSRFWLCSILEIYVVGWMISC